MPGRSRVKSNKIRIAVRFLLDRDQLVDGAQMRLAEHFMVSRQRISQIVQEQRRDKAK